MNWREELISKYPFATYPEIGNGWRSLLEEMIIRIQTIVDEKSLKDFRIIQIKEKFGTLRVYFQGADDFSTEIGKIIDEYETKSEVTCEACGEPGVLSAPRGWVKCTCEQHTEEWPEDAWD